MPDPRASRGVTSGREFPAVVTGNLKGAVPSPIYLADRSLIVRDLGLMPYDQALGIQAEAVRDVATGGAERLLVLEHPLVITLGRNSGAEHLLVSPETLAERGIQLVHAARGGSVTCHFPGQLVIYPILRLNQRPGGLRRLVFDLEEAVIRTLTPYGLPAARNPGRPGVWIQDRKIASIGLALKNWVTFHGLALNVGLNTSLFDLITPCGLSGVRVTSVHGELGREEPGVAEVKEALVAALREELA
ncbi:lipoyl(octanoyl) transferase LipB [Desulfonatronum thiodismutans]|uniref:lipoyl(octanoyl) transferase LipB n=1 Tax=Desulfonatronum thiodismutans TaxID=159290 RepID=UPI001F35A14C|nr:lipoyl(octanoyl) transferase LipB [Desulfonatronum thiodismutans]